jgi:enterochelin esterase-like enzyme
MPDLISPLLIKLHNELRSGNKSALNFFWKDREENGAPLIENEVESGELLVTFLYRNHKLGNHHLLLGCPANFDAIHNPLLLLENTDVWFLSKSLPSDLQTTYGFLPNAPPLPKDFPDHPNYTLLGDFFSHLQINIEKDALNPKIYSIPPDIWLNPKEIQLSLLKLPEADNSKENLSIRKPPKGELIKTSFKSQILGNQRNIWIYKPFILPPAGSKVDLILIFDGQAYTSVVPTPDILDELIDQNKIPASIAIFIDNPDDVTRDRELGCNPLLPKFLAEELIPSINMRLAPNLSTGTITVAGSSYGGLGAFYCGLHSPEIFQNVISMSGHLGWGAEAGKENLWIVNQYRESSQHPKKIFFDVGCLETGSPTFDRKPSFLAANKLMSQTLKKKNVPFNFAIYSGGHDYLCWENSLVHGLIHCLGDTH